jgi:cobyrinic acid a,c-diamide synthase
LYNGLELPLRRTLGWCKQCEGLVTAEEFRDINLIIKEMGELVRQVSALEKNLKNQLLAAATQSQASPSSASLSRKPTNPRRRIRCGQATG